MAHKRRAKVKKRQLPDPYDVLEGSAETRVEDIFDLIHEVNPTRRKLPPKEAARRYVFRGLETEDFLRQADPSDPQDSPRRACGRPLGKWARVAATTRRHGC